MSTRNKPSKFKLATIYKFDARRGYKRCTVSSVQVVFQGERTKAHANIWWDPEANLVVRCIYGEYDLHLKASKVSGKQIHESDLEEFCDFVADTLCEWVEEGADDVPNSIYATSD